MKVSQNPLSNTTGLGNSGVNSGRVADKQTTVDKSGAVDKAASHSARKIQSTEPSAAASTASQVQISDEARMMKQAAQVVRDTPDVRADRVAELKARVRAGTYQVDAKSVADKLVEEHFLSDFGKSSV